MSCNSHEGLQSCQTIEEKNCEQEEIAVNNEVEDNANIGYTVGQNNGCNEWTKMLAFNNGKKNEEMHLMSEKESDVKNDCVDYD